MIKILTIIGARPQFIKAAAISREIRENFYDKIEEIIVHTGQHYDQKMSNVFFDELRIPREKYNLSVGSNSHAVQTADMMVQLEKVVLKEDPKAVLVYGDTNSTVAAALVASKLHIKLIHVEAGVRGYNKDLPEEVNRIICDHLSTLLFVPTESGMDCLNKENVGNNFDKNKIANHNNVAKFLSGDIMYDNTKYFSAIVEESSVDYFSENNLPASNFILATTHRPGNTDKKENLVNVFDAFVTIAEEHGKNVIIPLHPRTLKQLKKFDLFEKYSTEEALFFAPPASFLEMIILQKRCDLVVTDSGGVQKEAFFMKKPCVIMMNETAWHELVTIGSAVLADNDYNRIVDGAALMLKNKANMKFPNVYGDGKASAFICEKICQLIS